MESLGLGIGIIVLLIVFLNSLDSKNKKDAAMAAYQMQSQPQKPAKRAAAALPDNGGDPVLSELRRLTGRLSTMENEIRSLKAWNAQPPQQIPAAAMRQPQVHQPQYPRQSSGYQGYAGNGNRIPNNNGNGNGSWPGEEWY